MYNKDDLTQALAFVTAQAYKINGTVYETIYPDWNLGRFIFIDTSGPEWSPGIMTYLSDLTGKANWQSGAAKDIPLADVSQDYQLKTHHLGAIGYQYNLEEVNAAIQVGGSLSDRRARAARLAYTKFLYGLGLFGDAEKGLAGFTNYPGVTIIPAPADGTGSARAWIDASGVGLKTPAQIIRDINLALQGVSRSTFDRVLADTVMLPQEALDYIAATPYSATTMETILSFIMRTNLYTMRTGRQLTIVPVPELGTAATDTTSPSSAGKGRLIAYNNSPEYMRFHLPMPHRFLPVYQDGPLNYVVPGIFRTGGVEMQSVAAIRYIDGISTPPS
jgi:hypothetical protein